VERNYAPFLFLPDVYLRKSPIIGYLLAVEHPCSLQAAGDHGRIAIDANMEIGSYVAEEFHPTRASEVEDFGLGHYRHFRNGYFQIIRPEGRQGIRVTLLMSGVPYGFKPLELSNI